MPRASKSTEEPPEVLQPPETPQDYRTDPEYGKDNYFTPIDEGIPCSTYYELKGNLSVPIPKQLISQKPTGRGKNQVMIDYVNVTDLKDLLDERVGVWTADVTNVTVTTAELLVVVRLTIYASDGSFSQDGTGTEWLGHTGYGDTFSNAYAQAFRRACEGHGLGRELWRKSELSEHAHQVDDLGERPEYTQERPMQDPVARSLGDMLTTKQLGLIKGKAKYLNIDIDEVCLSKVGCKVEELSKRAASDFIEILNTMQPSSNKATEEWTPRPGDSPETAEFMSGPSSPSHDSGPPASDKQKNYIRNLCSDKGKNEELIALELFKCEFDNITKSQASQMISHLLPEK